METVRTSTATDRSGPSATKALTRLRVPIAVAVALALLAALAPAGHAPAFADNQVMEGQLDNGTAYRIVVPEGWDGTLILHADIQGVNTPLTRWVTEQGHAIASRSRNVTDWDVRAGSDDLVELKGIVSETFSDPDTTVVIGASLGGLVVRDAIDAYPGEFDGAIPMCGGGAGLVGMWNNRLDATFALDVLLSADGEGIDHVHITNQQQADQALRQLVSTAMETPEGQARVALAGAIAQVSGRATGADLPDRDDVAGQLQAIASSLSIMLLRRSDLEATAGGNMSWNVGVDYAELFARSDTAYLARELYREAGLDLRADLDALAVAPRIAADQVAVDWARGSGTYSGELAMPVLDVYTQTDPRAALSEKQAYARYVREAGDSAMLRQVVIDRAGHCSFTTAETAAAIDATLDRVERGRWASTAVPLKLNQRADRLDADSEVSLGSASFMQELGRVTQFPRPFANSWDAEVVE